MAVKKGDFIYYANFEDDNKIYRIKSDKSKGEIFLEDSAGYLNIVGNDLYYINKSDDYKNRANTICSP